MVDIVRLRVIFSDPIAGYTPEVREAEVGSNTKINVIPEDGTIDRSLADHPGL